MDNSTLLGVWEAFESSESNEFSLYQSALFRFTLPGLGGNKPSGARLNSKEIANALKVVGKINLSADIEERLRGAQKQTFALLNTPKNRQRQPRYYLNKFIDWAIKNEFFPSDKLPEEEPQYVFYPHKINRVKSTNFGKRDKFAFSFNVDDYETELLQPEQIKQHLQRIKKELDTLKKYRVSVQGVREVTADMHEVCLKRLLGWLYREKRVPLAEISLERLVPFTRLNYKIDEFGSELDSDDKRWFSRLTAKTKASETIKEQANSMIELLREFFEWFEIPLSSGSKHFYIDALVGCAKFSYRHETDKTTALNFEDIPLISRLKVFHKEVEINKKISSSHINKYLPWSEVLEVIEKVRFEAEMETHKQGNLKENFALSSRAKSLQSFLLLGFFVLVPPPRQREIRELEMGRTLKYGIFENGRFTSFEKMLNPDEAKYYIHLLPEDYKTGDIYGEWLGEFPNTEFYDGCKFYDYLSRWFFQGYQDEKGNWLGMRELVATPGEKTVFVRDISGTSHAVESLSTKIKSIITRWTGVPISPHDLRHLYRTHIDDPAAGATYEERESAAYWMRHSSEMAQKTYSHLSNEQKLRAGGQMAKRLNQQLLKLKKRS